MGYYKIHGASARIIINTDALSKALESVGSAPVADMAAAGAAAAQSAVPPSARRFIRWKRSKEFPLKSGKLPKLSQMLSVPVALVVNDSMYAEGMEYGTSRKRPWRPLGTAFEALRPRASYAERGRAD